MVERPGNVAGNNYSMYVNNCHSKEIRIIHKKTISKSVHFWKISTIFVLCSTQHTLASALQFASYTYANVANWKLSYWHNAISNLQYPCPPTVQREVPYFFDQMVWVLIYIYIYIIFFFFSFFQPNCSAKWEPVHVVRCIWVASVSFLKACCWFISTLVF